MYDDLQWYHRSFVDRFKGNPVLAHDSWLPGCIENHLLIDKIYVEFGDHVYHQTVGIRMGTSSMPHWWQICSYIHMNLILYNIYKRVR